ncbi:MAG: tripartite tricarboxylate transporter substrate binding protein [Alphaproteobacteria bacterium]|nr:tripartite tricarboxylate transporter substrate binding protein [Alphaproteobacteria bacterium]
MTVVIRRRAVALAATAFALPSSLRAQATWPTGPVTFVVGYAPGGSNDINARELAHLMSPILGQQVVVDNKGGANGSVGLRVVANARPDGYMLSYSSAQTVVVNQWVQKGMIDILTTLMPICQTTDYQYVLAVNPKVPANTAAELVTLARTDPGKLTFSSAGVGSGNHLAGALFADAAGIQLTHVPYKGTGPALADVLNGVITMNFSSLPPAVPQIKVGTLKALAVTGTRRITSLPDVPTLKEQGIDATINGWHGLFAPARTPDVVLDRIERDARQAMKEPRWAEVLAKDGVELPPARSRGEFARYVADEHAFWGGKLKALKIDME